MKRRILVLSLLVFALAIWNFINFSSFFINSENNIVSLIGKNLFSKVCHMEEGKLFHLHGINTLLCSRCSGIYAGALFTGIMLLAGHLHLPLKREYFIYFILPALLDSGAVLIGIYSYNFILSFITGILLGIFGFYYFYFGIFVSLTKRKKVYT